MSAERQQGKPYQRSLFEGYEEGLRHDSLGNGGTGSGPLEESQTPTASDPARALTERLMEEVCQRDNLNRAYRRVKANRGAPGVDGMTIDGLAPWLAEHKQELTAALLDGSYEPQPVRGVEIPKPGGGMRQLGIPTVIDRLVQQAFRRKAGHCHRSWQTCCWTIWTRNWNDAATASAVTPTTATSMCSHQRRGNGYWRR